MASMWTTNQESAPARQPSEELADRLDCKVKDLKRPLEQSDCDGSWSATGFYHITTRGCRYRAKVPGRKPKEYIGT